MHAEIMMWKTNYVIVDENDIMIYVITKPWNIIDPRESSEGMLEKYVN